MKKYLLLTNEELKRTAKPYLIVVAVLMLFEFILTAAVTKMHEVKIEAFMRENGVSMQEAVDAYGKSSFAQVVASGPFLLILGAGMMVILIGAFVIWYRDWFGKTNYIYRLLLLPGSRSSIYFAKLTTIVLLMFGFVTVQWLMFFVLTPLHDLLLPPELFEQVSIATMLERSGLMYLYDFYLPNFVLIYLFALLVIVFIFALVLIERSYRKGKKLIRIFLQFVILGAVYGVTLFAVDSDQLFANEKGMLVLAFTFLYLAFLVMVGLRTISKKITV